MKRLMIVAVAAVVLSGGFAGCRGERLFSRRGDECCPCEPCGGGGCGGGCGGGEMVFPSTGAAVIETLPAPAVTLPGPARTTPG